MKKEVRPIDANALNLKIREYMSNFPNSPTRLTVCRAVLSMLGDERQTPTIRPTPANIDLEAWTAEWIEDGECEHKPYRVRDAGKWKKYKCSKCGYKAGRRNSQKYCPSCGNAMTPEACAELEKRIAGAI